MSKPPYPILCPCCKLPAGYTFEKTEIKNTIFCYDCTHAAMVIINYVHPETQKYAVDAVFKHSDEIWANDIELQTSFAKFT